MPAARKAPEQPVVLFGNANPQMQTPTGSVTAEHLKQSVTRVELAADTLDEEKVTRSLSTDNDRLLIAVSRNLPEEHRGRYSLAVYEAEQILAVHAAGDRPDWVSSTDPELAQVLAGYFGCAVGEPVALLTEGGRDALHEQHLKKTSQPAAFVYGALSKSSAAPKATDTTLSEEITTAEGGLLRAEMTFAHTAGTNTSTLTHTWTANAKDSLPVTLHRWANFNKAESGGTMGEDDELNKEATLSASGDSLTITFTLTAG
jgi:hypothetical protein